MQPIHKLLSRIRWDPRFRAGRFDVGYFDRLDRRVITVPFESLRFPVGTPAMFEIWDDDGTLRRIPFHRVRRVTRDGRVIWERHPVGG